MGMVNDGVQESREGEREGCFWSMRAMRCVLDAGSSIARFGCFFWSSAADV